MTYNELVKAEREKELVECLTWLQHRMDEYDDKEAYQDDYKMASIAWNFIRARTAENAALKEAQRWVPVGERLPEVGKCVLVRQTYSPFRNEHGEFEEVTVGYLHQPTDNRRKPYFYWVAVSDYGDMVRAASICPGSKYITHWQPIPHLPKGE